MTTNNKFGTGMDDKFEDALTMLAAGIPVDTILAEAGQEADQLRPLLEMVGEISTLKQIIPIPPPQASLHKMLAHAEKLAGTLPPSHTQPTWQINFLSLFRGGFRLAAGLTTALMVFVLVGGMLSLAVQQSLPGDTLYQLKQARETLELNLTGNSDRREALNDSFNQRRRTEIEALLEQGKVATVSFEDIIQAVTTSTVKINNLTVEITPETKITGQVAVGARVRIEVLTQPSTGLLALTIIVLEPGSPPAPSPTSTPTATLPKIQATDTLPTLQPTATAPPAQTNDTIDLTPTPTAANIPTIDVDNSDDNLNENNDFEDNSNDNGDNRSDDDFDDSLNDNDDFDDDDFNDNDDNRSGDDLDDDSFDDNDLDNNDDFVENDNDNSNDNDVDSNSNDADDRSGSSSGSNEDGSSDNQDNSQDGKDNSGKGSSNDN